MWVIWEDGDVWCIVEEVLVVGYVMLVVGGGDGMLCEVVEVLVCG